MSTSQLLYLHFEAACPEIHTNRLKALMDVAEGLQRSQSLSLTAMGRGLTNKSNIKSKIKKVDRLENNPYLSRELEPLYSGLSGYIFKYVVHESRIPIIIDLCYMKDDQAIQMLSAEVALKGRSLPLYREIFSSGELKGRAESFLSSLSSCIPSDKTVVIIMDAGFGEDWFEAIEKQGWQWLSRIRQGRHIKLDEEQDWKSIKEIIPELGTKTKSYNKALITKEHSRECRIITASKSAGSLRKKLSRGRKNDKAGSDCYRRMAKEPWILATNLPASKYSATQVMLFYSKRMQIEESFRDLKSHQFGLSARYIRTRCNYRWGVKMLLAAIVQVMFWVIGVIGHSQGFQKVFQANTVKDKKVFSYFYLGQLIVEFDKLNELIIDYEKLPSIIEEELARKW